MQAVGESSTVGAHQRQAMKSGAVIAEQIGLDEESDCPDELRYLYDYFIELNETRAIGMGLNSVQYQEIDAWSRLSGIELDVWEVWVLRDLDRLYLKVWNQHNGRPSGTESPGAK